jgi:hypothetical protein
MKKILVAIGVLTLIVGFMYAGQQLNKVHVRARSADYMTYMADVDNLFTALQKYRERVGSFPPGGNIEVSKALQGGNPKNVIVIIGAKTRTNDKGEFIDPWGTPLKIYFSDNGILIRSAGPNRRFEDSTVMDADDITRSN